MIAKDRMGSLSGTFDFGVMHCGFVMDRWSNGTFNAFEAIGTRYLRIITFCGHVCFQLTPCTRPNYSMAMPINKNHGNRMFTLNFGTREYYAASDE